MVKTLTKHGNSFALILDKPILELLHLQPDTPLSLEVNGRSLTIKAAEPTNERAEQIKASFQKVNQRYGHVLKQIVD